MTPVTASAADTRSLLRVPTTARPTSSPGNRTVLVGLVAALVLGILGMHALATHGATAAATNPASSTTMNAMSSTSSMSTHDAAMTSGGSLDAHAHPHSAAVMNSSPATTGNGTPADSSHPMTGMVMLCVAMLAAAALTLLALLVVRIVQPRLPTTFHPADVLPRAAQRVRGNGPPHEWAFSVIRC